MSFYKCSISILSLFLLLLSLVSCSPSGDKKAEYKQSGINTDFPVPANVESSKVKFDNIYIEKGEKYSFENIGGEEGLYSPNDYLAEINVWGWETLEEERMGHIHFFRKGKTIVTVIIKEDYFELYEMKEDFPMND